MKGVMGRLCTALALAAVCGGARAAQAGDNVVQFGWLHLMPNSDSTPLHTELKPSLIGTLAGVQSSFDSPGTSARVGAADTVALITTHFLTQHFAVQFVGGVPARVDISGAGLVKPTGLLGNFLNVDLGAPQNNPLVSVQEWTPVALLQYYFGRPAGVWHPYLGLGVSYAWFSGYSVNGEFRKSLESNFGNVLSLATGHSGPTSVSASASRSWNPVYNAGLSYDISRHWGIATSLTYSPLASTATINVSAQDGTVLASSKTRLSQNALITALLVNYRFHF
ncbi:OmpW/AlkL family protein [Nevskia soli]|uniref:OmpW/AlkL family protein n=1 Tax=Nevskia soli TaxID=418856 RepID=UPI00068A870C|nr:OmpW family outer membrane protein [Nevskia soli]